MTKKNDLKKMADVGIPDTPTLGLTYPLRVGKRRQWGHSSPHRKCRRLKWMVPYQTHVDYFVGQSNIRSTNLSIYVLQLICSGYSAKQKSSA